MIFDDPKNSDVDITEMIIPAIFTLLIWWVLLLPIIMILYRKSVVDWIPEALTQDAKRRYRRIMADNARKRRNLINSNDSNK